MTIRPTVPSHRTATGSRTALVRTCDLVLLSWNRADLLVPCVERILRHTGEMSRLLIIDNASTDRDTVAYLERLQQAPPSGRVQMEVVRRAKNEGFAVGMNDGLARTTAPWICLLNNDVLVTGGWLEEMIHVAEANPAIGLLNPMSNEFNVGPMQPGPMIDRVAERLRANHGRWLENWMGVGFCLFLPRAVFERVGYFDHEFRFLYSEDTDYSLRVRWEGFLCAIAEGAYVFHHQRSTMKRDPSMLRLMEENEARFYRKWAREKPQRVAYVLTGRQVPSNAYEEIRELANEGHRIWVFCPRARQASIPRHFQVRARMLEGVCLTFQATCRVLLKKKGFHRIVVSSRWLGAVLRRLKASHQAEVVAR